MNKYFRTRSPRYPTAKTRNVSFYVVRMKTSLGFFSCKNRTICNMLLIISNSMEKKYVKFVFSSGRTFVFAD